MVHQHVPVYRVGRRSWRDPLDTSYSWRQPANRWNTTEFPALYCCCSEGVARAVALDNLRRGGMLLEDLQPPARPVVWEIDWAGVVVDMASSPGIATNGFPPEYPAGVEIGRCRDAATIWHDAGHHGIVCRSAAMLRLGLNAWTGDHRRWGELVVYPANLNRRHGAVPKLRRIRADDSWLRKPWDGAMTPATAPGREEGGHRVLKRNRGCHRAPARGTGPRCTPGARRQAPGPGVDTWLDHITAIIMPRKVGATAAAHAGNACQGAPWSEVHACRGARPIRRSPHGVFHSSGTGNHSRRRFGGRRTVPGAQ